jgi:BCD family chlorophyll transporter-like MFS transporter
MSEARPKFADAWKGLSRKFLPFADVASEDLPLSRLLRLSLFQVSAGMVLTLIAGTLNRVMIVELLVPAWLVAFMISLPLVFAPLRALIGHKSDTHRSALGWRRGPYIWFGSMLMFGGLAIMPFSLLILSGDATGPIWIGQAGAALAFLMLGAGMHAAQTAGLALATDIAPEASQPRVVALLYVMLLVGMAVSALIYGALLEDFNQIKLIRVIQGSAVVVFVLNIAALWKQEARDPRVADPQHKRPSFSDAWQSLIQNKKAKRLLLAVALGTLAFGMQDILLEPFGAERLEMSVSETTRLTAIFAVGTLIGFAIAARGLTAGFEPHRLGACGLLVGIFSFCLVIFAEPLGSATVFQAGALMIGLGGGLFSVCMLTSAMTLAKSTDSGIALGAWGAVQATAAGVALALGGGLKDAAEWVAQTGWFGETLDHPAIGYTLVYHVEILLLFVALAVLGPIARLDENANEASPDRPFGLAAFPE